MRLLQELISTEISSFQGVASFTSSLTVKMPLGGSGLKWVWERPLGVVFDPTCSRELEGTLRSWSLLKQPSLLQMSWKRGRITFMKHDLHCPVAIWIHAPADIDPQIPLRIFLPHSASAWGGGWHRTKEGLTLSGECKGSAPDTVMHPALASSAVVGLLLHLNPKCVNLGSRIDSRFLVQNKQTNKWSGEGAKQWSSPQCHSERSFLFLFHPAKHNDILL